ECLRRAASLFDGELADAAAASAVYRRLLEADPRAPELARWIAILEEAEDLAGLWEAYGRRLEDPIAAELEPGERAALFRGRAQLRRRLGDESGAARDLESSLEDEPDSGEALLALGAAL